MLEWLELTNWINFYWYEKQKKKKKKGGQGIFFFQNILHLQYNIILEEFKTF